jgi:enoyl-CoA hydratase
MQELLVNQADEASGIMNMQDLAKILGDISRHSPEDLNFWADVESVGWKLAVAERDEGSYD